MRWSLRVLTVRGVPIRVHATFAVLLLLLAWRISTALPTALVELAVALEVFMALVLHELGHAVAAMRHRIAVSEIELYPFGGVARLASQVTNPRWELQIAAAGPVVNLALAAVAYAVGGGQVAIGGRPLVAALVAVGFWTNLLLGGLNLIPAYPLDGGRLLRAALTPRLGWARATVWAASLGQITAVVMLLVGFVHDLWVALGALLILPAANTELRRALGVRGLEQITVKDLMLTELARVEPDDSLPRLLAEWKDRRLSGFVLWADGAATGFLPASRAWALTEKGPGSDLEAQDAALPVAPAIPADTPVAEALGHLDASGADAAPVVAGQGEMLGVVTRASLERVQALNQRVFSSQGQEHRPE